MDYSKIDKKVKEIVKKAQVYMLDKSYDDIYNEVIKAYNFSRDAHE
jgi:dihydroneopterin aldolase